MSKVSDCCGAAPIGNGDNDTEDIGICPDCGEHCEYVEGEEPIPTIPQQDEEKPVINEVFADNGEHSHWELIDPVNGKILWSQAPASDEGKQNEAVGANAGDEKQDELAIDWDGVIDDVLNDSSPMNKGLA